MLLHQPIRLLRPMTRQGPTHYNNIQIARAVVIHDIRHELKPAEISTVGMSRLGRGGEASVKVRGDVEELDVECTGAEVGVFGVDG